MSLCKRKSSTTFDNEEDIFQVKKKNSFFSTETTDSISKEDPNLSPLTLRPHHSEPLGTPEHRTSVAKDKLSALKTTASSKKKHRSSHSSSYEEIKKNYMSDSSSYDDHYKAVQYKNYRYILGTCLLVRNEADAYNDFICKLIRIIKPKTVDSKGILAFLEVQWYYKKEDLPKKFAPFLPHISVNELFLSSHKDFIMVDCINGPCKILGYAEYDKLETIPPATFFSRSVFDTIKKKLEPPIEKWGKNCICRTPMNPDCNYIQCDKCNVWYHLDCIGISVEDTSAIEEYYCNACKDQIDTGSLVFKLSIEDGKEIKQKRMKINEKLTEKGINEFLESYKTKDHETKKQNLFLQEKLAFNLNEDLCNVFRPNLFMTTNQNPFEYPSLMEYNQDSTSLDNLGDLFSSTTTQHGASEGLREEPNQEFPDEEKSSLKMETEFPQWFENELSQQATIQEFISTFNFDQQGDSTEMFFEHFEKDEANDEAYKNLDGEFISKSGQGISLV